MTFRDDFDTLNTGVWEVYMSNPNKGSVNVSGGKLVLRSVNLNYDDGWIDVGIRSKNPLNLVNTQIDIPLEYIDAFSDLLMHFGIAVTNVPFTWSANVNPLMRGFWFGMLGFGYQDEATVIQMWDIKAGTYRTIIGRPRRTYPEHLRVKIGNKGVYFFEVINEAEWLVHDIYASIDYSNCYLAIMMMAAARTDGVSSGSTTDYISAVPFDVPETLPNFTIGETVTPPEIPSEVAYPLMQNMIPALVANAMLSMAERVKK